MFWLTKLPVVVVIVTAVRYSGHGQKSKKKYLVESFETCLPMSSITFIFLT